MVKDITNKPSKELVEEFTKKQKEYTFMAEVLRRGDYIPSQVMKMPAKDEVGNIQVLKLKKEIFQSMDDIASLIQTNAEVFQQNIDNIEMYYYILKV